MLLRCIFFPSILALVAARASYDRFDIRDAIEDAEIQYLQAREEYMEEVILFRRVSPKANPFFVHPVKRVTA